VTSVSIDGDNLENSVAQIFSAWKIEAHEREQLIGFDNVSNRVRYDKRVRDILFIYRSISQLIVRPGHQANLWIRQPNRHFCGRTPLSILIAEQEVGFQAVKAYLARFL
jgi:hypothetical protein